MVKVSSSDVLSILRRFDQASDEHVPRHIERLKYSHPSPISTLISFTFLSKRWSILFDDTADDDQEVILQQLSTAGISPTGQLMVNPHSSTKTYGLPFHGKDVYLFVETPTDTRLDVELTKQYPETSRSTWQKHIANGHVTVNEVTETSTKRRVQASDQIEVRIPEGENHADKELPILYLDEHVIVVDKPAGILTHSKGALNDEFTVADFFRRYTTDGLETNRPGIIHRLDRDTSGVIIGARDPETAHMLKRQFSERTVKKTYQAVVYGIPEPDKAVIDVPIGRNPTAPSTFRPDTNGKSAQTAYEVNKQSASKDRSLVELRPKTGRTHQLRVHMKYIGHPIVGDRIYGTADSDRLFLHAHQLEVTIADGKRSVFTSPIPAEFTNIFE